MIKAGLGHLKNAYKLINLRALKFSTCYKSCIFQCMDKIFSVEFQRYPLKFHTKYLIYTFNDASILNYLENMTTLHLEYAQRRIMEVWCLQIT